LTSNDELLEQLGQALDGDSAIRHCETVDGIAAQLSAKRAQVVMLDAREHAELVAVVERVQLLADSCVVVVFAPAEQATAIATAIRRSAVFAVLPIPVETGKTAAVLEGARNEAVSRLFVAAPQVPAEPAARQDAEIAASMAPARALSLEIAGERDSRPALEARARKTKPIPVPVPARTRRGPTRASILVAVPLLVVALVVAWLATRDRTDSLEESSPQAIEPGTPQAVAPDATALAPASLVAQDGSLEELLIKAQAAFRNRRYAPPESDSALTYYQAVLVQQPDNGEALEGMQRIRSVLMARIQAALGERRFDDATGALAQLELIDPSDPELTAMSAKVIELQVTAALESGNLDRAGQLLRDATEAGTLPPDRASDLHSVLGRRQAEARTQRQLAEAARRDAELRALEAVGAPVESTQRNSGVPTAAVPRTLAARQPTAGVGAGSTPDSPSAGSAATQNPLSSRPGPAGASAPANAAGSMEFRRTRYVEPVYPKDALEKGLRGDVRVRITVDTDGHVRDAEVISSSPPGVFEKSALTAVRRWRFRPIEVDGKAVEASATTTVVFQPKE
jgi:protein TonB